MRNKKQKPADIEDVSNWQLAENADNVLHSRIQSYLLAQTFLVAAYATLLTVGGETPVILLARIMACLVTVLGFVISWYTRRRMLSILAKFKYLIDKKLAVDPNFQDYITQGGTVGVDSATRNEFVDHVPIIIQSFWVIALVMTLVLTAIDFAVFPFNPTHPS
jgi:hypothetical protein